MGKTNVVVVTYSKSLGCSLSIVDFSFGPSICSSWERVDRVLAMTQEYGPWLMHMDTLSVELANQRVESILC